ncbi:MAG: GNAT family N-acetyltransferase [bacterium]|nr:GNAT family N-acetyltransferase [bacterium]
MNVVIQEERIEKNEYIEFLSRTDLGSQYPKERFEERIEKLVHNASISLTARIDKKLIGVCFGITDFAYWLFITDLGIDRAYAKQGIGTKLLKLAHKTAGGEKDIAMYTCANEQAIPFYEKMGMSFTKDVMELNHIQWTSFTVGE